MNAGLRAAGEHRRRRRRAGSVSARLADRVRAGRAGRDRRVVRPAQPEVDRDLPARRVDEHVREEERRDAVLPALAQQSLCSMMPGDAADRGADEDPGALRGDRGRRPRPPRPPSPPRRARTHVALDPPRLLGRRRRPPGRSPSPRPRSARGTRSGRTRGSSRCRDRPGDGGVPGRRRVVPERRDRSEPGDGDAPHRREPTTATDPGARRCLL